MEQFEIFNDYTNQVQYFDANTSDLNKNKSSTYVTPSKQSKGFYKALKNNQSLTCKNEKPNLSLILNKKDFNDNETLKFNNFTKTDEFLKTKDFTELHNISDIHKSDETFANFYVCCICSNIINKGDYISYCECMKISHFVCENNCNICNKSTSEYLDNYHMTTNDQTLEKVFLSDELGENNFKEAKFKNSNSIIVNLNDKNFFNVNQNKENKQEKIEMNNEFYNRNNLDNTSYENINNVNLLHNEEINDKRSILNNNIHSNSQFFPNQINNDRIKNSKEKIRFNVPFQSLKNDSIISTIKNQNKIKTITTMHSSNNNLKKNEFDNSPDSIIHEVKNHLNFPYENKNEIINDKEKDGKLINVDENNCNIGYITKNLLNDNKNKEKSLNSHGIYTDDNNLNYNDKRKTFFSANNGKYNCKISSNNDFNEKDDFRHKLKMSNLETRINNRNFTSYGISNESTNIEKMDLNLSTSINIINDVTDCKRNFNGFDQPKYSYNDQNELQTVNETMSSIKKGFVTQKVMGDSPIKSKKNIDQNNYYENNPNSNYISNYSLNNRVYSFFNKDEYEQFYKAAKTVCLSNTIYYYNSTMNCNNISFDVYKSDNLLFNHNISNSINSDVLGFAKSLRMKYDYKDEIESSKDLIYKNTFNITDNYTQLINVSVEGSMNQIVYVNNHQNISNHTNLTNLNLLINNNNYSSDNKLLNEIDEIISKKTKQNSDYILELKLEPYNLVKKMKMYISEEISLFNRIVFLISPLEYLDCNQIINLMNVFCKSLNNLDLVYVSFINYQFLLREYKSFPLISICFENNTQFFIKKNELLIILDDIIKIYSSCNNDNHSNNIKIEYLNFENNGNLQLHEINPNLLDVIKIISSQKTIQSIEYIYIPSNNSNFNQIQSNNFSNWLIKLEEYIRYTKVLDACSLNFSVILFNYTFINNQINSLIYMFQGNVINTDSFLNLLKSLDIIMLKSNEMTFLNSYLNLELAKGIELVSLPNHEYKKDEYSNKYRIYLGNLRNKEKIYIALRLSDHSYNYNKDIIELIKVNIEYITTSVIKNLMEENIVDFMNQLSNNHSYLTTNSNINNEKISTSISYIQSRINSSNQNSNLVKIISPTINYKTKVKTISLQNNDFDYNKNRLFPCLEEIKKTVVNCDIINNCKILSALKDIFYELSNYSKILEEFSNNHYMINITNHANSLINGLSNLERLSLRLNSFYHERIVLTQYNDVNILEILNYMSNNNYNLSSISSALYSSIQYIEGLKSTLLSFKIDLNEFDPYREYTNIENEIITWQNFKYVLVNYMLSLHLTFMISNLNNTNFSCFDSISKAIHELKAFIEKKSFNIDVDIFLEDS